MDIHDLLNKALSIGASDLHITVGVPPICRIDGELKSFSSFDKLMPNDTKKLIHTLLNDRQEKILDKRGEVDFSYSEKGLGRFRVNIYKQRNSLAAALRTIPLEVPDIDDLELPNVFKKIAENRRGLVLVTGPTGSGKSTTLASMVNFINNTRSEHIITLEDPIEYLHRHNKSIVNQREIGLDTLNYGDALTAALRQDPDVILIGEMRDLETISTAVTAAETGHLVFSTLHTVNAVSTVDRIIDVFPPNQQQQIKIQLSNVLKGVISQQLLPRIDKAGRIAACEVMIPNMAIKNNIREGKTHHILSSLQTGRSEGMISMDNALTDLVHQRKISRQDALKYAMNEKAINRRL